MTVTQNATSHFHVTKAKEIFQLCFEGPDRMLHDRGDYVEVFLDFFGLTGADQQAIIYALSCYGVPAKVAHDGESIYVGFGSFKYLQ